MYNKTFGQISNNLKNLILPISLVTVLGVSVSCSNDTQVKEIKSPVVQNEKVKPFKLDFSGVSFTDVVNGADTLYSIKDGNKLALRALGQQDYFRDQEGKNNKAASPLILKKIDNEKPFTFTAKVTPNFTENGMFNAGVLFIYANDSLWHKLCFEKDFKGNQRVITVYTDGTSDDAAHDIVNQPYVYMKIVSNTHVIISYYSLDGKTWERARIYKNNYPKETWIGLSNQCPRDTAGCEAYFEEISLTEKIPANLRLGE